ncbi:MAG: ribose 5-phosphate isomerase A [Clostridium butyricum]|nr:ribose 5-phosphate isomerase A [Clostridium butyricum]
MIFMKKKCAMEALKYIKDKSIIGLGGGSTISYLVSYIKETGLDVEIVTPSSVTERQCIENGLKVVPAWAVDSISVAFDGCDEIDNNLTALKSGGGIHTKEKIIASMAEDYILLVDESKVVEKLDFKYPVVLEIIPESIKIVEKTVKKLGGNTVMRSSSSKDGFTRSDHGLFLMDVNFNSEDVNDISVLNDKLKKIVGVVDTSLFYNIATKAIVSGENGVRVMECER